MWIHAASFFSTPAGIPAKSRPVAGELVRAGRLHQDPVPKPRLHKRAHGCDQGGWSFADAGSIAIYEVADAGDPVVLSPCDHDFFPLDQRAALAPV